jgi:D-threonine aldolase
MEWYAIKNIAEIDSPALLVYKDRVHNNIETLVKSIDDSSRLRPHIKTCKSPEVAKMMMVAGMKKFKCATVSEAEMLASAGAPDVLLAYQPVGPKATRLVTLLQNYPQTKFSCLIDNISSATLLGKVMASAGKTIDVYIDLNVGMNRTGIAVDQAIALFEACRSIKGIKVMGLHAYDGHIRDKEYEIRKEKCDNAFAGIESLQNEIEKRFHSSMIIVAGGTPTYTIHNKRKNIECSPGTFVYWDKGYEQILPEQQYKFAALVLARVISKPADDIICIDLGHKAIASENPLNNRVYFLNDESLQPTGHSEEHMTLRTSGKHYEIGDVLYGVPHHVCPTVALHDRACVVENNSVTDYWTTDSRNRKITI